MRRFIARNSPLFILAGLCLVLAVISPNFREREQSAERGVPRGAWWVLSPRGQTLVILTAGIDLSVGSVAALSGVVAALLMTKGQVPIVPAVVAGSATGLCCGLISGVVTAKGKLPSFIVDPRHDDGGSGDGVTADGRATGVGGCRAHSSISAEPKAGTSRLSITLAITARVCGGVGFWAIRPGPVCDGRQPARARASPEFPLDRVRIGAFAWCGLLTGFAGVMLAVDDEHRRSVGRRGQWNLKP